MDPYLNLGVVRLGWLVSSKFGSSWMIRNKVGRLALDCRDLLTTHDGFASFIWYKDAEKLEDFRDGLDRSATRDVRVVLWLLQTAPRFAIDSIL